MHDGRPGQRRTHRRRRRPGPGWIPNQHGAWAMLVTPLVVGALASPRPGPAHLLLLAFWLAGYLSFSATALWLKSRRRPRYRPPMLTHSAVATVLGLATLAVDPPLIRWAPLFLVPLTVGLVASATRHERALVAGLATAIGATLMTVVAHDLGGGAAGTRIWTITAVLAGYFGGTVFYVKSAIRQRGSTTFLLISVLVHVALATAALLLLPHPAGPVLALVGAALTVRAAVVPRMPVSAARIGAGEIAATLVVATGTLLTL